MEYLTEQQVLYIHARLIAETGGERGIRDLGALRAAAARPRATFDGEGLCSSLPEKAAALLGSLILNHPFVDGNKRTAVAAAALFLRGNGLRLASPPSEVETFALAAAGGGLSLQSMADWIRRHTVSA